MQKMTGGNNPSKWTTNMIERRVKGSWTVTSSAQGKNSDPGAVHSLTTANKLPLPYTTCNFIFISVVDEWMDRKCGPSVHLYVFFEHTALLGRYIVFKQLAHARALHREVKKIIFS
jgi:hypothetical protein